MSRAIGRLDATVENLTRNWQEQDNKATQGRRLLYERFESLKDKVADIGARVDQLATDITGLKPSVRSFEDGQQRRAGARTLLGFMWGGILAGGGAIGWVVHEIFGGSVPPHH